CEPLETEDFVVQSMPDASPTRWHLAHTTWFFETFVLRPSHPPYAEFHPDFVYLFNSYYNAVGPQYPRPQRGLCSRPTVKQIMDYRVHVDRHMRAWFAETASDAREELGPVVEVGLNHEQQHQELMLTDIKHVFSCNPIMPVYRERTDERAAVGDVVWVSFEEGVRYVGHEGKGFCYDNECPRHRAFVPAFELANRLVTNGEYLEFIRAKGYERPELWLSDGWGTVEEQGWEAPLYWERRDDEWWNFTLGGMRRVEEAEPVCHVSYYEADAFARWAGARLPTEAEWETAGVGAPVDGNFVERGIYHPQADAQEHNGAIHQLFGDVWEWTSSAYSPYPGYKPVDGALGEYNGKFMCNQFVLRGGSCATHSSHVRPTYRNFFAPSARWQFSGIRLAR
ncbi:MAG: ergothioneine biosynthesis protein EgtB, partial [Phycisphaerae bacterium]